MKTLHAIRTEPSFLEWMQLRFEGIHENWHYRGDEVWFNGYIGAEEPIRLGATEHMWRTAYDRWVAAGADLNEDLTRYH